MIQRLQVASIEVINQYIERGDIDEDRIISVNTIQETETEIGYLEIFYIGTELGG